MDGNGDLVQVVNFEEEFNDGIGKYMERVGVAGRGLKYHVVSIIGPQSSGKSTLMNMLFGTDFKTMQADCGRYQVTQGVWMSCDPSSGILVMDLEGTDSRERGEFAGPYERKSALFALAMSDVLMINIWTQDVGRLSASNLLLLKNILELDIQLFQSARRTESEPRPKTRLLFVLRDHVSSPLSRLSDVLTDDIAKIWEAIEKPEELRSLRVEDLFSLSFFSLPHKNLATDQFEAAGRDLQDKFRSGEMFVGEEYSRRVDADGLSLYASNVWSTIRSNQELDLPSQREMVSVVRCDEAVQAALDDARAELAALGSEPKPVGDLDGRSRALLEGALAEFDGRTVRQMAAVAARKRAELKGVLTGDLARLVAEQADVVSARELEALRAALDALRTRVEPWVEYGHGSARATGAAMDGFDRDCQAAEGVEPVITALGARRREFCAGVDDEAGASLAEATATTKRALVDSFAGAMRAELVPLVDAARGPDLWTEAAALVASALDQAERRGGDAFGAGGLALDEAERAASAGEVRERCQASAVDAARRAIGGSEGVLRRMKHRFNQAFRFDEEGHPRVWAPRDDVKQIFEEARVAGCAVADLLATIRLGGPAEEEVLDAGGLRQLRQQLESDAAVAFVDARHAQEMARMKSRVPSWALLLLMVLGYSEAKTIYNRPTTLILFLLAFAVCYAVYFLRLHEIVTDVFTPIATPYLQRVRVMIDEYLQEASQSADTAVSGPAKAAPVPSDVNSAVSAEVSEAGTASAPAPPADAAVTGSKKDN